MIDESCDYMFDKEYRTRINFIKEQYPFLKEANDFYVIGTYQRIQEEQLITEFLYTVDSYKVAPLIKKEFGNNIQIEINKNKNSEIILIKIFIPLKDILDKLVEKLNIYGYFIANISNGFKSEKYKDIPEEWLNRDGLVLKFEPKYDPEYIPQGKVYHLTPDVNYRKIKTLGLTPKTQGKISDHPGRIYLYDELYEGNDNIDLAIELWNKYEYKKIVEYMYLLEIDLSKLKDHKFFEDPNFYIGNAFWTFQNIPPYTITFINKILVNPKVEQINYNKI